MANWMAVMKWRFKVALEGVYDSYFNVYCLDSEGGSILMLLFSIILQELSSIFLYGCGFVFDVFSVWKLKVLPLNWSITVCISTLLFFSTKISSLCSWNCTLLWLSFRYPWTRKLKSLRSLLEDNYEGDGLVDGLSSDVSVCTGEMV